MKLVADKAESNRMKLEDLQKKLNQELMSIRGSLEEKRSNNAPDDLD